MAFWEYFCCLLSVAMLPTIVNGAASVTLTTPAHHTQPIGQDHLLSVLQGMHHSHTFRQLSTHDKILLVELLAAAEVDAVTHYIDTIGFDKFLVFLDVVTKINATEAHMLEHYMIQELNQENQGGSGQNVIGRKRDLVAFLARIHKFPAVQSLSASDQALLDELLRASETHTLTPVIHREGYARIVQLIEDIGTPTETHAFISYMVSHLNQEAAQHSTT
ncbi:uncharacterized protein LOC133190052 [Saccostrea echinata]|uniref:uncharacterized protein LOC133190052 n=1 Tax=Saccostrea echinata TaxID=191078 RepID=UPI002A836E5E|nr:uncharacterized protein LOC133190052 [Saccostrea echinata]